jgi:hypothetical protein
MARKPQEFNTKQNDMLDDVKALQMDIDAKALGGMEAIKDGDNMTAFFALGDIRNLALETRNRIGDAQRGKYTDE